MQNTDSAGDRTTKGAPPPHMHPTAIRLIETAVELLDSVPLEHLSLKMVLEHSGVNLGSLYYHFGSFPAFVDVAIEHRYIRNLRQSLVEIGTIFESTSLSDARARFMALVESTIAPERRKNRLERVQALGVVQSRPQVLTSIGRAQQEITDSFAEFLAEAQRRGWVRNDLDPVAMSAFIQAMVLGRVVDDISERPIDAKTWCSVALPAFRTVLFGD